MEFFIYKDNRQQGPFTPEQLGEAGISSETLVWREGMAQWTPAWQVDELKDILAGRRPSAATPPPIPPATDETQRHEEPDNGGKTEDIEPQQTPHTTAEKRRRRAVTWLAVAAVAFFLLLMTCPGQDKHTTAVTDNIVSAVTGEGRTLTTGNTAIDMIGGIMGEQIARQFIGAMVTQVMTVDNYVIFSVGKVNYGGRHATVSFGILGHVFTFGTDRLQDMMHKDTPDADTMAV